MNSKAWSTAGRQQRAVRMLDDLSAERPGDTVSKAELPAQHPELAENSENSPQDLEFFHTPHNTDSIATGPGVPIPPPDGSVRQIGEYLLVREIGRGGMGVVYEAVQPALARRVALKILPYARTLDTRQLLRFKNESLAAARLDHPNIVRVISVGHERDLHFYAMQYVEGDTLAEVLTKLRRTSPEHDDSTHYAEISLSSRGGSRPDETPADGSQSAPTLGPEFFRRVADWGAQAADALDHAHAIGVIHRDIKPSNLLLDNGGRVLIADFGVALMQNAPELTQTGDLLGTARYMSPEQWQGRPGLVDHRADIYSLGATLYELLTLRPAFQGEDRQHLQRLITDEAPAAPRSIVKSIPHDLETIVLKALAKDRDDRYHTAEEMADDLRQFLRDQPIRARRPTLPQRVFRWSRKHRVLVAAGVALLALATVGLSVSNSMVVYQRDRAETLLEENKKSLERERREQHKAHRLADRLNEHLYALKMSFAFTAWQTADVDGARQKLDQLQPLPSEPDRRGIEWSLLRQQLNAHRNLLTDHDDEVYCVAYSKDGRLLATGGKDAKVCLWHARTGEQALVIDEHGTDVNGLAFRHDGRQLATAAEDGKVRLFNTETGALEATLPGDSDAAFAVQYAQNGALLVSAGRSGIVRVWDPRNGVEIDQFSAHTDHVESLDISPDGAMLATAGRDDMVHLWGLPTGLPLLALPGHRDTVLSVAFSPDGQRLASGGEDQTVIVWDTATGDVLRQMPGHDQWIQSVAFSNDGRMVVSAGKDATVRLWDVATGKSAGILRGHGGRVWSVAISPDGDTLATAGADGTVKIWPWSAAWPFASIGASGEQASSLAVSPKGDVVATVDLVGKVVLRDAATGRQRQNRHFNVGGWNRILFSDDGQQLFLADGDRRVRLLNAATLEPQQDLGTCDLPIESLCLHPTEPQLVALGASPNAPSALYCWRLDTPSGSVTRFDTDLGRADCFQFHPNGQWLALGQHDGNIVLRNWPLNRLSGNWKAHQQPVTCVCFNPEGTLLASASQDGLVCIWDWPDGHLVHALHGHLSSVQALSFARDGRTLASGGNDGVLRLWSVSTGQELTHLARLDQKFEGMAFLPGNRGLLAITTSDGADSLLGWFTDGTAWPHPLAPPPARGK